MAIEEIQALTRKYSDWQSPKGLRAEFLPTRLFQKAKKLHWDPADIDFSQDATDWASLNVDQQMMIAGLARGFMVGEEGVTLDILPLLLAIADEGRTEETMFLTTFAYEEAKHVDFFDRWFKAIGADPIALEDRARERMIARGVTPPDRDRTDGLFEYHLPRIMRRLLTDRSPEAFLDASVTYNQFVEGCLAIAGYRMWNFMFESFGVLPGIREGLGHIQRDERRHIAYGTYLCRRLIAANPELFEFAKKRMIELRDGYYMAARPQAQAATGNGSGNGQQGGYGGDGEEDAFLPFLENVVKQADRRIAILEKAKSLSPQQAEFGTGSEEAEEELAERAEADLRGAPA
jgi:ribonucleoside-diphosphate reductase beta chain